MKRILASVAALGLIATPVIAATSAKPPVAASKDAKATAKAAKKVAAAQKKAAKQAAKTASKSAAKTGK